MHGVIFVSHFTKEHSEGLAVYKNSEMQEIAQIHRNNELNETIQEFEDGWEI